MLYFVLSLRSIKRLFYTKIRIEYQCFNERLFLVTYAEKTMNILDSADDKCECKLAYAKDAILGKCTLLSLDFFLGEWMAKDTLCSDSCRIIPYKVRFYKHPTDDKLCCLSNFASQLCSTKDTAVCVVKTRSYKIVKLQSTALNCINPLYFYSYNYNTSLKRLDYYFYVIVNQDTITWRTILER